MVGKACSRCVVETKDHVDPGAQQLAGRSVVWGINFSETSLAGQKVTVDRHGTDVISKCVYERSRLTAFVDAEAHENGRAHRHLQLDKVL